MEQANNHIDDLIGKYLAREASGEEVRFVERWIAESEGNKRYFDQIKLVYSKAANVVEWQQFDTDEAWNKVRQKLKQSGKGKVVPFETRHEGIGIYWKIAASIIIILSIGIFSYLSFNKSDKKVLEVVAEKTTETDTLPDGSDVFLNKQTKLVYSFNKKKNTHIAKLSGEAYFNINHNDDKRFVVEADGVFIKDIGTSFNVKAYPESNTIEVVVEEGEVMFYTDTDSGVYLRTNGKGIYNKKTKTFTIEEPEPNVTAYKTKFFIFSDTDLKTVVQTLNSVYDKKISINEKLKKCRLTVTFNDENIDEISNVIAETLGVTVKNSGNGIELVGSGCGE